jgi:ferredoxin-thioredoxin reductase catalytic subunit
MRAETADSLFRRLQREAEASGYHLNPDTEFTKELVEGLLTNIERYGYMSCPCRLAEGERSADLDIICPCDYRDPDLTEHGCCYCALYVSREVAGGEASATPIPERRPSLADRRANGSTPSTAESSLPLTLPFPLWRCSVCGYLCARENPPGVCPICKADRDRFHRYL